MRLESKLNVVREYHSNFIWLVIAALLAITILIIRLVYLQLSMGEKYATLSEQNFIQERVLIPLRGRVIDAEGRELAGNRPAYNVHLTPNFVKDMERTLVRLEGYLNLAPEEVYRLRQGLKNARGRERFREILVKTDITRDQLALLESNKLDLPGITVRPGPRRAYPMDLLFSHVLGYVGRVSDQDLESRPNYHPSDQIGKKGLEMAFEDVLHGQYGFERVVVDAHGRQKSAKEAEVLLKDSAAIAPKAGLDLQVTLNLDLQQAAEKAFTHAAGGVVAIDVETGFILVWLSTPGFDPNKFATGISYADWQTYQDSIFDPLMDKVAQASYFPGSTYKVVPAIAGLESGRISTQTHFGCNGSHALGSHTFHCWKRAGHGSVDFNRALKESCDVFFYNVGEKVGYDAIYEMANRLGLGEKPGVGINHETAGVLPTKEWHLKIFGRPWYVGDTLSHVIGQGDLKVSPLQLAVLYAAIANGGKVLTPQLVSSIKDSEGQTVQTFEPKVKRVLDLRPETLPAVRAGLFSVVNEPGGTAYLSRLNEPTFSGKTGSAQVASLPKDKRVHDAYQLKDHGWFVGFAPAENPRIVVVAMVEHGEHGSWVAPVVRDVIAAWWEKTTGRTADRPNTAPPPIAD